MCKVLKKGTTFFETFWLLSSNEIFQSVISDTKPKLWVGLGFIFYLLHNDPLSKKLINTPSSEFHGTSGCHTGGPASILGKCHVMCGSILSIAACKHCQETFQFPGNTTNSWYHLRRSHPEREPFNKLAPG